MDCNLLHCNALLFNALHVFVKQCTTMPCTTLHIGANKVFVFFLDWSMTKKKVRPKFLMILTKSNICFCLCYYSPTITITLYEGATAGPFIWFSGGCNTHNCNWLVTHHTATYSAMHCYSLHCTALLGLYSYLYTLGLYWVLLTLDSGCLLLPENSWSVFLPVYTKLFLIIILCCWLSHCFCNNFFARK